MSTRRSFLSNMLLGFLPSVSSFRELSQLLNIDESAMAMWFDGNEFHLFDDGITNLHFYFTNVSVGNGLLSAKRMDLPAYMIVRLPQQHLTEQMIEEGKVTDTLIARSRLSGFSFLAFELFPAPETRGRERRRTLSFRLEKLMEWDNSDYFKLLTTDKVNRFVNLDLEQFKAANENQVSYVGDESNLDFYKRLCGKLFEDANIPITLLEIPQGMYITPLVRQETGKRTALKVKNGSIKKRLYIYNDERGTVYRSVRALWNASMFLEKQLVTAQGPTGAPIREAPVFRALAYTQEAPAPAGTDEVWLPSFLDKQTLVYLSSLARKRADNVSLNNDPSFDITAETLRFTGLGVITRLHYKNMVPPNGINLAEYEHHITLGRDEYVKVAYLGAITATGQRALHIKIGQRKIRDGVAYMDYKEYIEILQKEIVYYDPALFKEDVQFTRTGEPANYVEVRKKAPEDIDTLYTGGFFDNVLGGFKRAADQQPLFSFAAANTPATHFRRHPFKSIQSIAGKKIPIDSDKDSVKVGVNKSAFWPMLLDSDDDLTMEFSALDWNDQKIHFKAPFMFIYKDAIDRNNEPEAIAIYTGFFETDAAGVQGKEKKPQRRRIGFTNQAIAFTPDHDPKARTEDGKEQDLVSNKLNVVSTEFIEVYFGMAKEAAIPEQSIFNLRYFPLFPQVRKSKVFLDSIRPYSDTPLASLIEYNEDYVGYAFKRGIDRGAAAERMMPYNLFKLIFNHTRNFINNTDEDVTDGYQRIKAVFREAGAKIGALVNPDIEIESIGLVKQGIALGKDLNDKYKGYKDEAGRLTDKIERFNPKDLLRGKSAEIFGGISFLDVLEEVLPGDNTPVTEIRNISARLEELKDSLRNNPVVLELQTRAQAVRSKVDSIKQQIDAAKQQIETADRKVDALREDIATRFRVAEIRHLLETTIEQGTHMYFLELDELKDTVTVMKNEANEYKVVDFITGEVIGAIERMEGLLSWLEEKNQQLTQVPDAYKNPVQKALVLFRGWYTNTIKDYVDYTALREKVNKIVGRQIGFYDTWNEKKKDLAKWKTSLLREVPGTVTYQAALDAYTQAQQDVRKAEETFAGRLMLLRTIRSEIIAIGQQTEEYYLQITAVYTIMETTDLAYYIYRLPALNKDTETIISKFKDAQNVLANVEAVTGKQRKNLFALRVLAIRAIQPYLTRIKAEYDANRTDLVKLKRTINDEVKARQQELKKSVEDYIGAVPGLTDQYRRIKDAIAAADNLKGALKNYLQSYEGYIKEQLKNEANGFIQQIRDYIGRKEQELKQEIDDQRAKAILALVIEARRLLQYFAALSQQDIVYTWHTTNFKDAHFGPLTFKRRNNPATELSVNVKSTIHYDLQRYPPVVTGMEYTAENILRNFGISFMDAIMINFSEVSFRAGSQQPSKFDVKISDVQFSGALSFVQVFEKFLKSLLGDAFRMQLLPQAVNIGYTLPLPDIRTPAFNFFNLTLNIDFWLYFNKQPMEFTFSLARPDNKFAIVAGVYAGFGYFSLTAEPKRGITAMEIALEFGGYFGLSLGPIRGEVKLAVGLYIRKDLSGVTMEGYFICEGSAKLWFVMIAVRFYMGVRSQGNYVEGRCTVSYSVRLGKFFKKSFSASYYKKLAGAEPGNNQHDQQRSDRTISQFASFQSSTLGIVRRIDFAKNEYYNQYYREVNDIDLSEWTSFINSYIDDTI